MNDHQPDAPTREGLSDEEREALSDRDGIYGGIKQGYYIGFDPTGVPEIDRILSALGWAGKAFHHTENWHDDLDFDYGPLTKGGNCADLIQRAANEAADRIEGAR